MASFIGLCAEFVPLFFPHQITHFSRKEHWRLAFHICGSNRVWQMHYVSFSTDGRGIFGWIIRMFGFLDRVFRLLCLLLLLLLLWSGAAPHSIIQNARSKKGVFRLK